MAMPSRLQPGGHQDEEKNPLKDTVKHRDISHEQNINQQLDRIAYLRSAGLPWAEAVFQLRDMVVGLEDHEFWTGIPPRLYEEHENDSDKLTQLREAYVEYGWDGVSFRAIETSDGRFVYDPTPSDLSKALRIIMRLLARKGILWKKRTRTRFAPYGEADQASKNGEGDDDTEDEDG